MNKVLQIKIPDIFITIFFIITGMAIWSYLFFTDINMHHRTFFESFRLMSEIPIIFAIFYSWIRTSILDIVRIVKKHTVRMPGELFIFSAIQIFVFYCIYDMYSQYNKDYYFYAIRFWIITEPFVFLFAKKLMPQSFISSRVSPNQYASVYESEYVFDFVISFAVLMISWALGPFVFSLF